MSYDQKITQVREIVESHNQNVDESDKINFEDFMTKLRKMGGTYDAALSAISWEDLEKCGLPRIMSRQVSGIFRKANGGDGKPSVYVSEKKAQAMSIKELFERYDSRDIENAVGKRLKGLAKKQPCVVFKGDESVNVDESTKCLQAIRDNYPPVTSVIVDGKPHNVYKIGERIDNYAEENPLYDGRPLRPGGVCDQTNRSWEGVPLNVRQLLYLAIMETEELSIESLDNAHNALDLAVAKDAETIIRQRYNDASLMFDEKEKEGELPNLRIKLGAKGGKKSNDPFYANKEF